MSEQWNGNAGDGGEAKLEAKVSPEVRERFEREKRIGAFRAFQFGEQNGIPRDELIAFIHATVAEKIARGESAAAARLLQATGVGTPEEIRVVAEAPTPSAGEPMREEEEGEGEELEDIILAADATFADLAAALEQAGERLQEAFDAELADMLDGKDAITVLELIARRSLTERVRDVLMGYGFTEDEIAAYFFIRFSKR